MSPLHGAQLAEWALWGRHQCAKKSPQRCGTSPWCAAAGGSCLFLGLLEIPWHRGGCVSVAEAEVGHEGDRGGLWLPPHLALLGKFLGGLTISLHHPYLWFSAHFRSDLSI